MLFTVVRYLPALEEETPGHRVEMAKKGSPVSDDGDDDSDDGDDSNTEQSDLFYHATTHPSILSSSAHWFYIKQTSYSIPETLVTTPPPKA